MNKKQIIADIEETAEMAFSFSQRLDYIIKNNTQLSPLIHLIKSK